MCFEKENFVLSELGLIWENKELHKAKFDIRNLISYVKMI